MRPDQNNPTEKKGKGGLIAIVLILFLILAAAAVIAFDVGGVRSQYIMGFFRDAPLIGNLLPPEEEIDPIDEMTEEEMRLALHVYRDEIAGLNTRLHELEVELAHANARIEHLAGFEERWQQYREASAAFAQILAHNDSENFVEFFEDIVNHDLVPQDILAAAFAQAVAINMYHDGMGDLVRTYNAMEAGRVAEDMERLLLTNQTLAVRLLRAMGNARRGEVFDEMEYIVSSRFAILLSVEPPTFEPLVPPPYLPEFEFTPPEIIIITPPTEDEYYEYEDEDDTEIDAEEVTDPAEEPEGEPLEPDDE